MDCSLDAHHLLAVYVIRAIIVWRMKPKTRRSGVRLINRERREKGEFNNLFKTIYLEDKAAFFWYTRMSTHNFQELLNLVKDHIRKRETLTTLSPAHRLALTLK